MPSNHELQLGRRLVHTLSYCTPLGPHVAQPVPQLDLCRKLIDRPLVLLHSIPPVVLLYDFGSTGLAEERQGLSQALGLEIGEPRRLVLITHAGIAEIQALGAHDHRLGADVRIALERLEQGQGFRAIIFGMEEQEFGERQTGM